jgi:hypothetical protein
VADQGGDIVGHRLEPERAVDVGGTAVRLQVSGDDPAAASQLVQDRAERVAGAEPAVEHDQRLAAVPVLLVIEGQAVHVCIAHVPINVADARNSSAGSFTQNSRTA